MTTKYKIQTFYKFTTISDCNNLKSVLENLCLKNQIKGIILIAHEGLNATISGLEESLHQFNQSLLCQAQFSDLNFNISYADILPFKRMKIAIKDEIVTLKQPHINPQKKVGHYVEAKDWNQLITNPEVTLIDCRNDFECKVGTFKGAINPQTENFSDFPDYVEKNLNPSTHKKVAMFCTGGIRCEKSTSYLLEKGFENVYHLKGGILKYLEEIPENESLWTGECFVFDWRVTVGHGVNPGSYDLCPSCGNPVSAADKLSPHYEEWVTCPLCYDVLTDKQLSGAFERKKQRDLAIKRVVTTKSSSA